MSEILTQTELTGYRERLRNCLDINEQCGTAAMLSRLLFTVERYREALAMLCEPDPRQWGAVDIPAHTGDVLLALGKWAERIVN